VNYWYNYYFVTPVLISQEMKKYAMQYKKSIIIIIIITCIIEIKTVHVAVLAHTQKNKIKQKYPPLISLLYSISRATVLILN